MPGPSPRGCDTAPDPLPEHCGPTARWPPEASPVRRRASKEAPMPDHDRGEGSAKQMGGKVKEAAGDLTGDQKLKAEGKADRMEGKVQNAVGGVKDALRDDKRH